MDLRDFLRLVSKWRWLVAATTLVAVASAAALSLMVPPTYQATARLFVGNRQVSSTEVSQAAAVTQLSIQLLRSYAAIIKTRPIAERAIERERLPLSPASVSASLRAEPLADTQIIDLSFSSSDSVLAQRVVNAIAASFVAEVERIESPRSANQEPAVRVSVVEPALKPLVPVAPRPKRNMVAGAGAGLLAGLALAMLVEQLDVTVKNKDEVEKLTGAPVLAGIPKLDIKGQVVHLEGDLQSIGAEAFRKLRTALQFLSVDHPVRTLMVTSAFAQEGKSTTSLNLAAAFAHAGLRTVLVEADLRRPVLHKIFASDRQRGLTTCLIGRVPLQSAILPTPVRNLTHIPAGAVPPNPAELLASHPMQDILSRLAASHDIVVVDAPPLLPVADAAALAPRVDGVLIVAKTNSTPRDRLQEATEQVTKVGGRLLGIVLNQVKGGRDSDSYYYQQYGQGASPFETERAATALRPVSEER